MEGFPFRVFRVFRGEFCSFFFCVKFFVWLRLCCSRYSVVFLSIRLPHKPFSEQRQKDSRDGKEMNLSNLFSSA